MILSHESSFGPYALDGAQLSAFTSLGCLAQEQNKDLVENASAIMSLYGDEATTPCLLFVGP